MPGQRVAVAPNISCGLCASCKGGRPNHCVDFTTLGIFKDGGLAAYCVVPERACHPMSDHVAFEDAIWVEVLSCVVNSVDTVKALPGETVLVLGGGPTGALHALLFAAAGATVIVSDMSDDRLDIVRAAGITRTINPGRETLDGGSPRALRRKAPRSLSIASATSWMPRSMSFAPAGASRCSE